ncbi:MAG TPA: ubiquinone/menaquinone biosynthesis methyltransferase [Candidatus Binataceae bacterium]|nr:ubiquinone/menaquinone biosynthesis methyltransferase [Candidatus Binataceae bacterium]
MNLPDAGSKAAVVEAMFDRIAPRYDLMNRLMTFGMDRTWRRYAVEALALPRGSRALDLACGTGDFCAELARAGVSAVGLDFSSEMLRVARPRLPAAALVRGDALRLPLRTGSFDAVVSGFALRNFANLEEPMRECYRVLKSGGKIALLEVDTPASALLRIGHRAYFHKIVPLIGRLVDREAYSYLPASAVYLVDEAHLLGVLAKAGFRELKKRRLLGGAVQLLTGSR